MRIRPRGQSLYKYCSEAGISRDELSRRMGINKSTAWRVENGLTDPSPRFIAAVLTVTGGKFEDYFEIVEAAA
jgi:transcriptional regulator with XRE-family HTH domain